MDKRYEVFCLADRTFYETPDRLSGAGEGSGQTLYETARRPAPDGWRAWRSGDWWNLSPQAGEFPAQGWKIHVSACLDNAEKLAAVVWDYCVPRGIPFKFVPGPQYLYLRNSKYASRASSGKFATIYPSDEEQLHTVLRELGALMEGEPGPYVLTDLRWQDGPLYVRYGAFAPRHCDDGSGNLVPAIENAEGELVPDPREPGFTVPDWVSLPAFLEPQLAARNNTTVAELPYRIEQALHFSNGGGVYAGTDRRSGDSVVLKEGRPYAGLAADGADAVTRLEREKAALDRLDGLSVAPAVRDWFTLGEHRFLVMDRLPGRTLNSFFAQRHPLLSAQPDPDAVAEYTRWALDIHRAVADAVAALHDRGVVFNDLHMFNIMVDEDKGSVALLDFEAAAAVDDDPRQIVAHPGFIAPADRTGFGIDRYALACLGIALFIPMTSLLAVDPRKAAHLAEVAAGQFPDIPEEFLRNAVAEIEGRPAASAAPSPSSAPSASTAPSVSAVSAAEAASPPRPADPVANPSPAAALTPPGDWPRSRSALARAILASATSDRDDRVFPGDIAQFATGGGICLAHGAAGVLYALAETGAGDSGEAEEWLLRHTTEIAPGTPLGFWDGLLGVAWTLERLGHRERAWDLVDRVQGERWDNLTGEMYGGLAGAGLAFEDLARRTGEKELHLRAEQAAERLTDRLTASPEKAGAAAGGPRAGLLHGDTGPALLFLRLHERTGDRTLLDLAATALRRDLARCVPDRNDTLLVDEGERTMPYLGSGSAGIAMVLDDFLAHRSEDDFERARNRILPAAELRYYAQPGLFQGRAGMVLHLSRTTAPGATRAALDAQIAAMAWYAMPYGGGTAYPGDQMMRLSMDLATGTAGCLLALGAALHDRPVQLPFLPPPARRP